MSLQNAIQLVSVPAPAKVNLYLAVLGKRKDDYHDIVSVLAKLNLYDIVTVEQYGEENFLSCRCLSSPSLKSVRNLAEDAVTIWRKFTDRYANNRKRICRSKTAQCRTSVPAEYGLASSARNRLYGGPLIWSGKPLSDLRCTCLCPPTQSCSQELRPSSALNRTPKPIFSIWLCRALCPC